MDAEDWTDAGTGLYGHAARLAPVVRRGRSLRVCTSLFAAGAALPAEVDGTGAGTGRQVRMSRPGGRTRTPSGHPPARVALRRALLTRYSQTRPDIAKLGNLRTQDSALKTVSYVGRCATVLRQLMRDTVAAGPRTIESHTRRDRTVVLAHKAMRFS